MHCGAQVPKGATEAVQSPGLCRRWCPHLNLQGAAPAVARGSESAVGLWPLLCHECDLSLAPHSPASPLPEPCSPLPGVSFQKRHLGLLAQGGAVQVWLPAL